MNGRLGFLFSISLLILGIFPVSAQTTGPDLAIGTAECAPPGREPDQWLIGRWKSTVTAQAVEFRREGAAIGWTYTRTSATGAKPSKSTVTAVTASGGVAMMSVCMLELHGMFVTSEDPAELGRIMRFILVRIPSGNLVGIVRGLTGAPVQIALQRE